MTGPDLDLPPIVGRLETSTAAHGGTDSTSKSKPKDEALATMVRQYETGWVAGQVEAFGQLFEIFEARAKLYANTDDHASAKAIRGAMLHVLANAHRRLGSRLYDELRLRKLGQFVPEPPEPEPDNE